MGVVREQCSASRADRIHLLVFSKDRPFQLQQYLLSLYAFATYDGISIAGLEREQVTSATPDQHEQATRANCPIDSKLDSKKQTVTQHFATGCFDKIDETSEKTSHVSITCEAAGRCTGPVSISVLFTTHPRFRASYEKLKLQFPKVNFIEEGEIPHLDGVGYDNVLMVGQNLGTFPSCLKDILVALGLCGQRSEKELKANTKVDYRRFCDSRGFNAFATSLLSLLILERHSTHTMFGVDDALFCRSFDFRALCLFLARDDNRFGFHLRLHPGICYSHPAQSPVVVPQLSLADVHTSRSRDRQCIESKDERAKCDFKELLMAEEADESAWYEPTRLVELMSHLEFSPNDGSHDWKYPWELCGTLYRSETVFHMVASIMLRFGAKGVSHPNYLESLGAEILKDRLSGNERQCASPTVGEGREDSTPPRGELSQKSTLRMTCGCFSAPVMVVVTINRVQDIYDNPIYKVELPKPHTSKDAQNTTESLGGDTRPTHSSQCKGEDVDSTLLMLDELFCENRSLDLRFYGSRTFSSVHIGHLALRGEQEVVQVPPISTKDCDMLVQLRGVDSNAEENLTPVAVSVILPVYNAAATLRSALDSVVKVQSLRESREFYEVIAVDDASTDGSWEALCNYKAELDREVPSLDCPFHGKRVVDGNVVCTYKNNVVLRTFRNKRRLGIGATLNAAIDRCESDIVARMDADDISHPERLERQLSVFRRFRNCKTQVTDYGELAVLGTSVVSFCDDDTTSSGAHDTSHFLSSPKLCGSSSTRRWSHMLVHPSHPILAHWYMFFYCTIAHPSAMMSKSVLDRCGGYSDDEEHAYVEDYELWCRLLAQECNTRSSHVRDLRKTYEGENHDIEGLEESRKSQPPSFFSQWSVCSLPEPLLLLRKHSRNASKIHRATQEENSVKVVWRLLQQTLVQDVPLEVVKTMRKEWKAESLADIQHAIHIVRNLKERFLMGLERINDGWSHEYGLTQTEEDVVAAVIERDAAQRIKALCATALSKFPSAESLRLWMNTTTAIDGERQEEKGVVLAKNSASTILASGDNKSGTDCGDKTPIKHLPWVQQLKDLMQV